MNSKVKNVFNILLDVLIILFLVFATVVLVLALTQKSGGVSQIFGYSFRSIQTSSMEVYNEDGTLAEKSLVPGDIAICKMVDRDSFEIGEVVMFKMPIQYTGDGYKEVSFFDKYDTVIYVIHEIVDVEQYNGVDVYTTKGTANVLKDFNLKSADEFIAVYEGTRIPGVGKAIDFIQQPLGFLLCIVLPILIFVIFQTIRVIKNFIAYKAQKLATEGTPSTGELSEEEKRRIAEEYMRQLASNNAQPSTGDAPAEGE